MSSFKRIDDNDLDAVQYSTDWFRGGDSNEYSGTTHGTRTAGATATFTFNGTYVEVYGTQVIKNFRNDGALDPIVQFILDDEDTLQDFAPALDQVVRYQYLMYSSGLLEPKEHRIVMNSTVENSWVWLDFFVYDPSPAWVPTSIPPSSSSSSSSSSRTSTTHPASSASATSSSTPSPMPISTIVGSAVACSLAILLIGVIIGIWCYRRRRRANPNEEGQATSSKYSEY